MKKVNLYWAQDIGAQYDKELSISPIFTTKKEFSKWKSENKGRLYMCCSDRSFYNPNIGMSR